MIEPVNHFAVFETIKSAWRKVKGSKLVFFCISLLFFFNIGVQMFIQAQIISSNHVMITGLLCFLFILAYAAQFLLNWGLLYVGVQRAAGESIHLGMLRQVFTVKMLFRMIGTMFLLAALFLPVFLLFLLAAFLQGIGNTPALIAAILCYLLAVGGLVFLAVRVFFAQTIAAVEKANPVEAIAKSFQATRSNFWKLLGLTVINMYIIFFAVLSLGIGLIWALPYSYTNNGIVYRRLVLKQAD